MKRGGAFLGGRVWERRELLNEGGWEKIKEGVRLIISLFGVAANESNGIFF